MRPGGGIEARAARAHGKMTMDLLGNMKFVRLVSVHELPYAEAIQLALRREGVAAVVINDERFQHRSDPERVDAEAPADGFRIEVPESMMAKAQSVLSGLRRSEDRS